MLSNFFKRNSSASSTDRKVKSNSKSAKNAKSTYINRSVASSSQSKSPKVDNTTPISAYGTVNLPSLSTTATNSSSNANNSSDESRRQLIGSSANTFRGNKSSSENKRARRARSEQRLLAKDINAISQSSHHANKSVNRSTNSINIDNEQNSNFNRLVGQPATNLKSNRLHAVYNNAELSSNELDYDIEEDTNIDVDVEFDELNSAFYNNQDAQDPSAHSLPHLNFRQQLQFLHEQHHQRQLDKHHFHHQPSNNNSQHSSHEPLIHNHYISQQPAQRTVRRQFVLSPSFVHNHELQHQYYDNEAVHFGNCQDQYETQAGYNENYFTETNDNESQHQQDLFYPTSRHHLSAAMPLDRQSLSVNNLNHQNHQHQEQLKMHLNHNQHHNHDQDLNQTASLKAHHHPGQVATVQHHNQLASSKRLNKSYMSNEMLYNNYNNRQDFNGVRDGYSYDLDNNLPDYDSSRAAFKAARPPKETQLNCWAKFAKFLLFLANLVFWLSGFAFAIWGILTLIEDSKYNLSQLLLFEPGSKLSLPQLLAWSFIALGSASVLVGFCGYSALFKNNRWILSIYIFLILIVFALDLATGLLAVIFQEKLVANVRLRLANKLRSDYGVYASFTTAIDFIQTKFECCGLDGHFDYDQSLWRLQRLGGFEATVARTCCHLKNANDDHAHINPRPINESMCQSTDVRFHQSYRYRKGCLDDLEASFRKRIWHCIIACTSFDALILVCILFATCFCRAISTSSTSIPSSPLKPISKKRASQTVKSSKNIQTPTRHHKQHRSTNHKHRQYESEYSNRR